MEVFAVTKADNRLIFDDEGRVLMKNSEGFLYVPRHLLPENFCEEFEPEERKIETLKRRASVEMQIDNYRSSQSQEPQERHYGDYFIEQQQLDDLQDNLELRNHETKERRPLDENTPVQPVRQQRPGQLQSQESLSQPPTENPPVQPVRQQSPGQLQSQESRSQPRTENPPVQPVRQQSPGQLQSQESLSQPPTENPPVRPVRQQSPGQLQSQDSLSQPPTEERAHWTRRQILQLINAYKDNKDIFTSNSTKNTVAWRRISESIGSHTPKQCEAKFKYLKAQYTKKKDNMGTSSSGARAITFEYFEEFDEIFRTEPNIIPVATASSSTPTATPAPTPAPAAAEDAAPGASQEDPVTSRPPKRRRTRLEIQLEKFQKGMERREEAREKRMERFLKAQETCTNRICAMLEKVIDKI